MNFSVGKIILIGIFGVIVISILAVVVVMTSPVWGAIVIVDLLRKRRRSALTVPVIDKLISDEAREVSNENNGK